ncbi:MAG: hypothetical protein JO102_01615, partial [Elusimicrobia bacterium]|nr:hypothetical protein [Elusimicrobiota bacterium]
MKHTAALVAALLTYESVAAPLAQSAVITQPAGLQSHVSSQLSQPEINASGNSDASAFIAPFKIPASVGTTVEIHAPVSAGRMVYHLQDVHNQIPAQTNLAEMVNRLQAYAAEQHRTLVVAVEGAAGVVPTDELAAHPSLSDKEAVGAGLLRSGFLLGEEYSALVHNPGQIKIVGVENPKLYNANLQAREASKESRERILLTVREIKSQLNKLKEHNFNNLLNTLEKNRIAVEEGRMTMSDYLTFLSQSNPALVKKYPMVSRMVSLAEKEKAVDFAQVEKEGRLLVEEIIHRKSDAEVQKMMKDAVALREGRLSPLKYYTELVSQAEKIYPALEAYVVYLRESEQVNPDQLFAETQDLETEMAKDLVRHPLAYDLYRDIRWIERQEKFFSLNMIPQEWELQKDVDVNEIYRHHTEIRAFVAEQVGDLGYSFSTPPFSLNDLKVAVHGARDFYKAAETRDAVMAQNLDKILKKYAREQAVVAFVAGGFHTPGLMRELRTRGLAYQVIRPQLETQVQLSQKIDYPAFGGAEPLALNERANTDFLRPVAPLASAQSAQAVGYAEHELQTAGADHRQFRPVNRVAPFF